ncbi:MAG: acetate--CoA ligase family protein [Deltaproteobacteria bacterium]|nr:acetate--CoA ligase family protein [Deltaproteobacteria bacterium]
MNPKNATNSTNPLPIDELLKNAIEDGSKSLNEYDAKRLLGAYGIPVPAETVAHTPQEAVGAAVQMGYPVVVKGLGSQLLHKTEKGLVHLKLKNDAEVEEAARKIAEDAGTALEGLLVQPFVEGKREWMAGMFRDPQFGPVIMFGAGGIFTEALSDVAFRLAPLSSNDVEAMLDDIKVQPLLDDFRGEHKVDRKLLMQTLTGLSRLAGEHPQIAEIDINPLVTRSDGSVVAVDALVVLGSAAISAPPVPQVGPELIRPIFYPRSIAFVGASAQLGKWGHILVANTISSGYQGDIYLVNPKGGKIAGRDVYTSVTDIKGEVDLAVVTIPAAGVISLIPELQAKGITSVLLITSGFGETNKEGKQLEKELVLAARKAGIQILGPNTMGICNPHVQLNCTSLPVKPRPGSTTLVSQSGNMGTQFLAFAEQQGIGIRGFCGSGNEAMTTIEDLLETLENDPVTRAVMLYIESVKDGRRFFESARRVGRQKPIVLMKGGQSEAGTKAASSHTGALSTDSRIFNAVCRQAGIVKVEHSMDLLDLAAGFSSLPLPQGKRTAIMTLGGGWGVVTADLCNANGLEVPDLSPDIIQQIDQWLPPYWSRSNPIDLVGEHDNALPVNIIESLLQWDGCDAVINLGIMGRKHLVSQYFNAVMVADPDYDPEFLNAVKKDLVDFEKSYVEQIVSLMEKYQKPVLGVSLLTDEKDRTIYMAEKSDYKGVFYTTPERAVKTLSKMYEYYKFTCSL